MEVNKKERKKKKKEYKTYLMKEALKHGLCNNILAPMVYAILEL